MFRLNRDGHDESQYLPRGVPPVNAFRAQHGNVKWEGEAIKALTWFPDILHVTLGENGKELLSRDYLQICESIYRIVMSARNALGISDLRNFIGANVDCLNPLPPKDPFHALLTSLMPYQSNMCLWVVCDEYNFHNIALAKKLLGSIHNSLDMAKKVLDECRAKE